MAQKTSINEDFFNVWSPEAAYVLGIIYTDGCIHPKYRPLEKGKEFEEEAVLRGRISIGQKDPEIIYKVLAAMNCDAKVRFIENGQYGNDLAGDLHRVDFSNSKISASLYRIGLRPSKSRTIAFPKIPNEYMRDFIRGCWDGDGSFYYEKKYPDKLRSHYVSGSKNFVKDMAKQLQPLCVSVITIHETKTKNFYIKIGHPESLTNIYHYLYDGVSTSICYERKFDLIKNFVETKENIVMGTSCL